MRIRALLFTPVLVALSVLGVGASVASAATLYTNSAHTTPVPVGTTMVATANAVRMLTGTTTVNSCSSWTLNLSVTSNSGGRSGWDVYGGSFSGCRLAITGNFSPPWRFVVTGSGAASGSNTVFSSASLTGVSLTFAGGTYTGDLTSGVTASQPTSAGAPICLVFTNASHLSGPLASNLLLSSTACLTGAAASDSLG
jgi:hypothetical protein